MFQSTEPQVANTPLRAVGEPGLSRNFALTRTPFRISFFGGGTDYPRWYLQEEEGAVLSTTINKYAYVGCGLGTAPAWTEAFAPGLNEVRSTVGSACLSHLGFSNFADARVFHREDLPIRSGIGSSSSFIVGLVRAAAELRGISLSPSDLAFAAIEIEQNVLNQNVGSQDQVAAAYGGLNFIRFCQDGRICVNRLDITAERAASLEDRLMLFYTHTSRSSSEIAGNVISNIPNHRIDLRIMRQAVDAGIAVLSGVGELDPLGELLHESWMIKRALSPLVSNPMIDSIYETALAHGALGGKLLGAGAGGFMLFYVPPEYQEAVKSALKPNLYVPFRFESRGSSLLSAPDNPAR